MCNGEELSLTARSLSGVGLIMGSGVLWRNIGERLGLSPVSKIADEIVERTVDLNKHSPINPGDLHKLPINGTLTIDPIRGVPFPGETIADTFRSGSYLSYKTTETIKLYRNYSDPKKRLGLFWSRLKPTGPTQASLDLALDPTWKNKASNWVEISLPPNTIIHEGIAAPIRNSNFGVSLEGGGSQIFLNLEVIPANWITDKGDFL